MLARRIPPSTRDPRLFVPTVTDAGHWGTWYSRFESQTIWGVRWELVQSLWQGSRVSSARFGVCSEIAAL